MADTIAKETFTLTLTYEMSVNIDTGEILETRLINRSVDKSDIKAAAKTTSKKKVEQDESSEPILTLEESKYHLNSAAISIMGIESDDKIDIKYENGLPIIGTDESFGTKGGNKLTKSNTVAYRGNKNEELSKHGKEFRLIPHPSKPGLFMLDSGEKVSKPIGDDNVNVEEEDEVFDLNLDELVDDKDANITEIDSNFFKL